jgi:hypothetical protein
LELAAEYLNQKPDAEDMRVSAWYQSTFAPFFKGEAISYSKEKGKAMAGDYVVFYINQLQRRFPDDELFRYFETRYQPEKIIPLKGVNYAVIYPGPGIQHYVEDRVDEHRRVYRGIAALLGWDWPDANDPNRPTVEAGNALPFRLYWEYLGKVPEERFFFRLIGSDGKTWAEGISQPVSAENGDPATWRQGQIITEEGELVVEVRLLGTTTLETPLVAGTSWTTELYFQAEAAPKSDYRFGLSLVDGDGQSYWVWDPQPLVSFYPSSLWGSEEVVRSQVAVTPTARTPGGEYDMALTLLDAMDQPVGQTTLGPVQVEGRIRSFDLQPVDIPVGAVFGHAIELVGFMPDSSLSDLRAGDEMAVTLVWRTQAPVGADYNVTLQLLGADERVYGQRDAPPLRGSAHTSTWTPGEVLYDPYHLAVASDAPPGEYQLIVAMYLIETGERMSVREGGDVVTLGQVEVTPKVP